MKYHPHLSDVETERYSFYQSLYNILTDFYMPDSGDTNVTRAIILGSEDLAAMTMEYEHCKNSGVYEMCWEYIGKKINWNLDKERHLRDEGWAKYHEQILDRQRGTVKG